MNPCWPIGDPGGPKVGIKRILELVNKVATHPVTLLLAMNACMLITFLHSMYYARFASSEPETLLIRHWKSEISEECSDQKVPI